MLEDSATQQFPTLSLLLYSISKIHGYSAVTQCVCEYRDVCVCLNQDCDLYRGRTMLSMCVRQRVCV